MLKVRALLLGLATVGVKLYTLPTVTLVAGVPEIVGVVGGVVGGGVDVVVGGVVDSPPEFCVTAAEVPPQPARTPIARTLTANNLAIPTSDACRRIRFFMWSSFNISVRFLAR
jgi:hypothetical protein